MFAYQERVIAEKEQLDDRCQKLRSFTGGAVYHSLDASERDRLERQLEAMGTYSDILGERIAAFPK